MNALLLIVGIFPYIQSFQLSCNSSVVCSNTSSVWSDASVCPCAPRSGHYCNNETLVCNGELGLWCDGFTNTCTGLANLTYTDVTENSVIVHWTHKLSWGKLLYTQNYSQENSEWIYIEIPSTVSSWTITDLESNFTYFAKLQNKTTTSETIVWITTASKGDCEHMICGPGAVCELKDEIPSCRCESKTAGNPNDYIEGCKKVCEFRNQTFRIGDSFIDGCSICNCTEDSQIVCKENTSNCHFIDKYIKLDDPLCQIIQDPNNTCCDVIQCFSFVNQNGSGCIYKNRTYGLNEQFPEGCLENCKCLEAGFIFCQPRSRCPPGPFNCSDIEEIADRCCGYSECLHPNTNRTITYTDYLELLARNETENATEIIITTEEETGNENVLLTLGEPHSKEYLYEFNNSDYKETPPSPDLKREIISQTNLTELSDGNQKKNEEEEMFEHKIGISNSTEEKVIDIIDYSQIKSSTEENAIDLIDHNKTTVPVEEREFAHGNETINSIAEKEVEGRESSETKDWIQEKIEISGGNVTRNSDYGIKMEIVNNFKDIGNLTELKTIEKIKDTELANSTEEKLMNVGQQNETSDVLKEMVSEGFQNETGNSTDQLITEWAQINKEDWLLKDVSVVTNGTNATEENVITTLVKNETRNSTFENLNETKDESGMMNSTQDMEVLRNSNRTKSMEEMETEMIGEMEIQNSTNETTTEIDKHNRTEEETEMMTTFEHRQMRNKWNNLSSEHSNFTETDLNIVNLNDTYLMISPLEIPIMNCTEEMTASSNASELLLSISCYNSTNLNITHLNITTFLPLGNGTVYGWDANQTNLFNQTVNSSACVFYEHRLEVGEVLLRDCDAECVCEAPGRFFCHSLLCDYHQGAQVSGCLKQDFELDFEPSVNKCCVAANCTINSNNTEIQNRSCDYNGTTFIHNESLPLLLADTCDQECRCFDGNVTCFNRCPNISLALASSSLNCSLSDIMLSPLPGDECCTSWHCKEADTNTTGSYAPTCETPDGSKAIGEWWEKSPDCHIHRCECKLLVNGSTWIDCNSNCPIIQKYLEPTMDCPFPVLVESNETCLCPFVMCNKDNGTFEEFAVEVLNASSVRINVTVPDHFIHRNGFVELLYTDDAIKTKISTWAKEIFSPRNNTFTQGSLYHEMHNLRPATTYYFRGKLVITNITSSLSNVVSVETPQLPMVTSSTASLPALKEICVQLNVTDIQATSAVIVWRINTEEDKKLIDGIKVKYRIKQSSSNEGSDWSFTNIIHRDITTYTLINLASKTQYEVSLKLEPLHESTTEIVNKEGKVIFTTSELKDKFAFNITLTVDLTTSSSVSFHWSGLPFPMHKYVNLFAVYYKVEKTTDTQVTYTLPKSEIFIVDGLKPTTRYEVWVVGYLSNGDNRNSNVLEIQTLKEEKVIKINERKEAVPQEVKKPEAEPSSVYYEALIAVAVVAGICILGFIALLVLLLRKQTTATAQITTHKSSHDNPIYKPNFDDEMTNGKIQA